jgi:hypothetical protein
LTALALLAATSVAAAQQKASASADHVNAALNLPRQVDTLRARGVPESQTRLAINELEKRRVPATESRDILVETNTDAKAHGPVNNFGAFVQAQLAAGKRGSMLAAAIRAEHVRRGSKVSASTRPKTTAVKPVRSSKKPATKVVAKSSTKSSVKTAKPAAKPTPKPVTKKPVSKKPTTPPTSRGRP